ncbi:60S ribosomal protein L7-like 1 [Porphyridium purpureum]|uniref:Ribosome biogenesis protein RLP7 n=1 Tax=Porphyridium purpureum TaxID=35688 RepID=A0A5J4YYG2_PORPP|nr:60S ribosomal protein L7-like 1 [Porphyridium purpureum]|eukprot:POR7374..scf208_2
MEGGGIDLSTAPRVAETVLKRRKVNEKLQAQRAAANLRSRKSSREQTAGKSKRFRSPQSFTLASRVRVRNAKISKTLEKVAEDVPLRMIASAPPALQEEDAMQDTQVRANVFLVVRLGGNRQDSIPSRQTRILKMLGLGQNQTAVFVKRTQQNLALLRRVQNYVTYGRPTVQTIRSLIQKRAFVRTGAVDADPGAQVVYANRKAAGDKYIRTSLSNNVMVEDALGEEGLVCIEDIVQEIASGGSDFDVCRGFLLPFRLSLPSTSRDHRRLRPTDYKAFTKGGKMGYRGDDIDDLVLAMV